MKVQKPATYREEYAAKAGAVIQSPDAALPGWDAILDEGEELLWQGQSQPQPEQPTYPKLSFLAGIICFLMTMGLVFADDATTAQQWFGLVFLPIGIWLVVPSRFWPSRRRKGSFYSLSNRRAFRGETSRWGKLRLISWPITEDTSFRLIRDNPPSVRFYEGRLESGRRPRYHEAFEAIPDAPEVYKLLLRIQKDAA